MHVPSSRPMEFDKIINFAEHPLTSIVSNEKSDYEDEKTNKKISPKDALIVFERVKRFKQNDLSILNETIETISMKDFSNLNV